MSQKIERCLFLFVLVFLVIVIILLKRESFLLMEMSLADQRKLRVELFQAEARLENCYGKVQEQAEVMGQQDAVLRVVRDAVCRR